MKKILLWSAFAVTVSSPVYAEDPVVNQPTTTPTIVAPEDATLPTDTPTNTAQPAQAMNCDFKIPAKTPVEQSTVTDWAKNATIQAFTFSSGSIDAQLGNLKKCFTDQGWSGFSDALQKSGNLEAIKSQGLTVSSQIENNPSVLEAKDNQWKLTMPVQVVYQNGKEKITQELTVTLLIARKPSGDLGILQMIALPRQEQPAAAPANSTNPAPANTTQTPPPAANQ